jgi:hypothetical protein
MGRHRQYASDADRQRAYRQRKAEELARLRGASKRKQVSERLVKVLGMLGSEHPGERDNAAVMATKLLKEAGLSWYDVLDVEEPKKK